MQAGPWASYSSWQAITPNSTVPINCRAIYVGSAGGISVRNAIGGTLVTFNAVPQGTILPVELNQGVVDGTTSANNLVALS